MTVDFGMNDGGYVKFTPQAFKDYIDGLRGIAAQAKAAGIRVAWLTPSPVEKSELGPALEGYNETLEKFSEGREGSGGRQQRRLRRPVPSVPCGPGQGPRREAHQPHRRRRRGPPRPAGSGRHGLGNPQGARLPATWSPRWRSTRRRARSPSPRIAKSRARGQGRRPEVPAAGPGAALLPRRGQGHPQVGADPGRTERVRPEGDGPQARHSTTSWWTARRWPSTATRSWPRA